MAGGIGGKGGKTPGSLASDKLVIRLKRDRRIVNKAELTRLQRNFEACVREIEELEKRKTSAAAAAAIATGGGGHRIHGGFHFCGDGAAAAYPVVRHPRCSRFYRLDSALFFIQTHGGGEGGRDFPAH